MWFYSILSSFNCSLGNEVFVFFSRPHLPILASKFLLNIGILEEGVGVKKPMFQVLSLLELIRFVKKMIPGVKNLLLFILGL